ncbi:hypothetical protein NLJ89_g12221 [Agrocybe chaxingu]|uniref:Uncharacterized protein n=1 Tax=Agrocybe chaxingu TaxID=84603 RepID=A0A9W8MPA0_9AGAR|nr:hypothetical protein NLJ89_g12221 [Agrocybe chaxingu]
MISCEDPFSDAYAPAVPVALASLVDVSVHENHDHYHPNDHSKPDDERMHHPHEDTTTLPLSLSPKARALPVLVAPASALALASKSPALAPAFVHHLLEDLIPIPAIPLSLPIDSKPLAQPLRETGIIQHDVSMEARDGGLLFSSASDEIVREEAVPPSSVMASELSLLPLVSADHDMPMIDFDLAAERVEAGTGAGAEHEVQGWKWDDDDEEEDAQEEGMDPWTRHVVIGGEEEVVEVEVERHSEEEEDLKNTVAVNADLNMSTKRWERGSRYPRTRRSVTNAFGECASSSATQMFALGTSSLTMVLALSASRVGPGSRRPSMLGDERSANVVEDVGPDFTNAVDGGKTADIRVP